MILYFSGTGNSRWAARRLADALGDDEVVSINDALKAGEAPTLRSERPIMVVAPTYAWRLPREVDAWLRRVSFEGNRDVYFVLTCGGVVGNAAKYARRLCRDVGLRFRGLAEVVMPENYVALYDVPDEEECRKLMARAGGAPRPARGARAGGRAVSRHAPDHEGALPQRPGERRVLPGARARQGVHRLGRVHVVRPVRRALPAQQHRARRGPARLEG